MYKTIAFNLLILIAFQLCAQNVVISGKAVDYKGKEIAFYTYSDPIVHQRQELVSAKVGSDGIFSVKISINRTLELYTDLEKYTGTLVIEPDRNYIVTFPPFSPRTAVEAGSPFFKPTLYWLGLPETQNNDLNVAVRSFITEYNIETTKNSREIYQNGSKETVNEIIARLEQKYDDNNTEYFLTLKTYNYAELEYAVHQRDPGFIIKKYFARNPIELQHPTYQKCFGSVFTDFLLKETQDYKNRNITTLVNSGNFSGLVSLFEGRGYQKEFAELVVLKGLYDGYYAKGFDKAGIVKALDQSQTAIPSDLLKPIVTQIRHKLEVLAIGRKAPSIELTNRLNKPVTLETYRGKFIYLVFFKSSSRECSSELDSIVAIEKKFRQVLSIVSIATDENFDAAGKLWKDKGYQWELLNGSKNKQLTGNYNAEIVPAFYLLAPDGTFLLSQAPPPSRDFEPIFLKIFRDYNFKQRNKSAESN